MFPASMSNEVARVPPLLTLIKRKNIMTFLKHFVTWAVAFAAATTAAGAAEKVVNVFNWNDYVDETVLEAFTKETGIKVNYDTFDNNEIVLTKVLAGSSGYDVVVPTMYAHSSLIKAGAMDPLDSSKIPNAAGMDPNIMKAVAIEDPGNKFTVPYMWAPNAIGINVKKVSDRIGTPPPASLDLVFKPELSDKLADCGIYVLDSAPDIVAMALDYLGKDPNSNDQEDLKAADTLLASVRKNIRKFTSGEYITPLANGDVCVVIGYGGDLFQAKARASEAKNGVEIDVLFPQEGTVIAIDAFGIPKDAKNKDEAHAFINFMSRPDIAAKNVNYISFASPVEAAKPMISPEIVNNTTIYPTAEVLAKTYIVKPKEGDDMRRLTRMWTRYKGSN
jgi:putrescine transport system substrate-binding protein